jgi:non-specific protein-tyrosine kinase
MTLHDYLRILRERWVLVFLAIVAGLSAAGAVWFLRPPEYTSTLQMYVSAQTADSTQAAYQGAQLSQQRVTSYIELVNSTGVCEDVIRQLRLATTPRELAKRITATSKLDSVVIAVEVTGESPTDAAAVATAVGTTFPRLVEELERPSSPTGTPPVVVRVVQPVTVPDRPSSLDLPLLLALGLAAGLGLGVGAALVRNVLDTSVNSPDKLRRVAGVPNLGTIAFHPDVPRRPLTVHEDPHSPRGEAFRQLRTNLQFVDIDTPHKVVVVTSSLPGEGKTTTLANLAIALAAAGQRVLVIEADLRRPKLAEVLGLERSIGLTSVLTGRVRVDHAVQHWSGGAFDVLASGPLPPNPSELLASQHMADLLAELRERYTLVLLDTPPLLPVTDAAAVAPSADGVILVCRFKKTRCAHLRSAVDALDAVSTTLLGTIFTMVPGSGPRAYAQYNAYYRSVSDTALPTRTSHAATGPGRFPRPSTVEPGQPGMRQ